MCFNGCLGTVCRASATAEYVSREVMYNEVDLVVHVGDISYANGDPEARPPPHPLPCFCTLSCAHVPSDCLACLTTI